MLNFLQSSTNNNKKNRIYIQFYIHALNMTKNQNQSNNRKLPITKNRIYVLTLCLITLSSFGNNYAFNNPQALHQSIKTTLSINQSQFQLFYSAFAFPNIFAALFIGCLIDFLQIYRGFVILVFMVAFFQAVVAMGAHFQAYYVMLVGRFFFGICSQSLISAQAALVSCLFKRKNLALALGVVITVPEIGNALNSLLTFRFYELFGENLGAPFFMGVVFCVLCSLAAISAVKFIKIINKAEEQQQRIQRSLISQIVAQQPEDHKQTIKVKDLKQLKYSFWILTVICTINLGMYIPFLDGANGLLQIRFKLSQEEAGQMIMVTYFSAAILSLPSGLLVDKIGFRRYISIFGSVMLLFVQLILYFSDENTHLFFIILAFSLLGLGLAIYANCVLSSVSLIVKKKIMGTAFGLIQMLQSVALCIFPIISGQLVDEGSQSQQGYINSQLFFLIVGAFGVLASLGVFIFPRNQKNKLDDSKNRRLKRFQRQKMAGSIQFGSSNFQSSGGLNKSLLSTKSSISDTQQIQIQNMMNIYLPPESK